MPELTAIDTINSTILASPPSGVAATSIAWDGVQFTPPVGKWIRVTIFHDTGRQLSLGRSGVSRKFRRTGGIIVQCFAPTSSGTHKDTVQMAAHIKDLFEGNTIAGIVFFDASINEIPPQEEAWLQCNASISFQYDDLK